jgi:hypothetical protein
LTFRWNAHKQEDNCSRGDDAQPAVYD